MKENQIINTGVRIRKVIVFILFIVAISFPILEYVMNISTEHENTENRTKAMLPKFNVNNLDPFPSDFEKYYNDNINFRNDILVLNNKFKHDVLGIFPVKSIIEGKDGWFFLKKYIEPYINEWLFTNIELDSFYNIYSQRARWLDEKGIKQYIAIIPTKAQIYPEFLPDRYKKSKVTKTDQFIETVGQIPNINVIYLKDALLSEKGKLPYDLFYKTDQHWNEYGALVGLRKIISEIKTDFPEIQDIDLINFSFDTTYVDGLGMARISMLQKSVKELKISVKQKSVKNYKEIDTIKYIIPEVFPYKDRHQVFYSSQNKKLPKALIIRDSFTAALVGTLPDSFSETTYIWDTWCYELHEDLIEQEEPDIFLTIIIEANLPFIIYKHNTVREDGYIAIEPNKITRKQ
jgi:hypothetical protein